MSAPLGKVSRHPKIDLAIQDQGKGISGDDLENIFQPFTIQEFKRREGGYGLNLPKAKLICDTHGWDVNAESEGIGRGAKFIIDIPADQTPMSREQLADSFPSTAHLFSATCL